VKAKGCALARECKARLSPNVISVDRKVRAIEKLISVKPEHTS
jgi:hypothetical protein